MFSSLQSFSSSRSITRINQMSGLAFSAQHSYIQPTIKILDFNKFHKIISGTLWMMQEIKNDSQKKWITFLSDCNLKISVLPI